MNHAKAIIEEVFGITLSNKAPYYLQMGKADASGDLGNRTKINAVIWRLAEAFDQNMTQLEALQQQMDNVKKLLEVYESQIKEFEAQKKEFDAMKQSYQEDRRKLQDWGLELDKKAKELKEREDYINHQINSKGGTPS